jgi:hypothetical protein
MPIYTLEESALGVNTMFDQFVNGIGNVCLFLLVGLAVAGLHKLKNRQINKHQDSMEYYLFKISRVSGHSEYDVFCKSAEEWPVASVSKEKIDADFKDYLNRSAVPPYVHHFVRQNKHHIDELHLPQF